MKFVSQKFAVLFLTISFSGSACRSSGAISTSETKARIVERSRQVQPAWVVSGKDEKNQQKTASEGQRWTRGQPLYELVASKDKVFDITLGLDQAYELALSKMQVKVRNFLLSYWNDQGSLGQLTSEDLQVFESKLAEALEKQVKGEVVQDIYFEKLVSEDISELMPVSYVVYIHMQMTQGQISALVQNVRRACQESPRPLLQQLAQNQQAFPSDL